MVTIPRVQPPPALTETVKALTDYPDTNQPDPGLAVEALDLLAAADWVIATHVGSLDRHPDGGFGSCRACGVAWPCPPWREIQALTLGWLVRASTGAVAVARHHLTHYAPRRTR